MKLFILVIVALLCGCVGQVYNVKWDETYKTKIDAIRIEPIVKGNFEIKMSSFYGPLTDTDNAATRRAVAAYLERIKVTIPREITKLLDGHGVKTDKAEMSQAILYLQPPERLNAHCDIICCATSASINAVLKDQRTMREIWSSNIFVYSGYHYKKGEYEEECTKKNGTENHDFDVAQGIVKDLEKKLFKPTVN